MSLQTKTIEERYRQLTAEEHVKLRSDSHVGSIEPTTQDMWVWNVKHQKMVRSNITFCPGLIKIFDEILVNAADNFMKEGTGMTTLKVDFNVEKGEICVWNNGSGIELEFHKKANVYLPEFIFGYLRSGTNFDDSQKRITGGRNGLGAKLCNLFSTRFQVDICDGKQLYQQTWTDRMTHVTRPIITTPEKNTKSFTQVTFVPSFADLNQEKLDEDTLALMYKRVIDMAGTTPKLKVFLDQKLVPVKNFSEYMDLYVAPTPIAATPSASASASSSTAMNEGGDVKKVFKTINDHWQVGVALSNNKFQQMSFVNSCCTLEGGPHVDYWANAIADVLKKKKGITLTMVKRKLFLFVNARIVNPAFTSQTKVKLATSQHGAPPADEKWVKRVIKKLGLVDLLQAELQAKDDQKLKKTDGGGKKKHQYVDNHTEASAHGGKESERCTIIFTEGNSAAALAIASRDALENGRKYYGVFPLRGKVINARENSSEKLEKNKELTAIKRILGLQTGVNYSDEKNFKKLKYGHVMIMTDQDFDGSHIKGLILNLFDTFWPELLQRPGFMVGFITPIVKVWRGNSHKRLKEQWFYSMPKYQLWKSQNNNGKGWNFKFYKGLGTSTSAEGKEYFSDLDTHLIPFKYTGPQDSEMLKLAFSKEHSDQRKKWLENRSTQEQIDHTTLNENGGISYSDFVTKELVLHNLNNCERAIPSMVDGLKPSQRKIIFSCLKRKQTREIKVVSLAGYVIENAAYHHGDASLIGTIVGLAQNYTGSGNNINLLTPSGQFGSRGGGGKDAASARYIHTRLEPVAAKIFREEDRCILEFLQEDGISIEPRYYLPVVPMVLVNGANGIGSGWSTFIPCYNPVDIVENLKLLLDADEKKNQQKTTNLKPMLPWYRGWRGHVEAVLASSTSASSSSFHSTTAAMKAAMVESKIMAKQQAQFKLFALKCRDVDAKDRTSDKKEKSSTVFSSPSSSSSSAAAAAAATAQEKIEKKAEKTTGFKIQGQVVYQDKDDSKQTKTIRVQEIPVGKGTHDYIAFIRGELKTQYPSLTVEDVSPYDDQVSLLLKANHNEMDALISSQPGILKKLKLETSISVNNMVLFNSQSEIKHYKNGVEEILTEFFTFRLERYHARKTAQLATLARELKWLNNRARFVSMIVKEQLVIRNIPKNSVIQLLVQHKFDAKGLEVEKEEDVEEVEADKEEENDEKKNLEKGYAYLMAMPLWNLTLEKVESLKKQAADKQQEMTILEQTSVHNIWRKELDEFLEARSEQDKLRQREFEQQPKEKKDKDERKKNDLKKKRKPRQDDHQALKKLKAEK
jgi:DNA gyrase/topoisomerase IV subunit B